MYKFTKILVYKYCTEIKDPQNLSYQTQEYST